MNTHFSWWLDGSIIGLYLLATMAAGLWVRRYVGKVEDYLIAGREMNVYLGIASLAATEFGIITCMYTAQAGYKYGFAGATPGICQAVAMFLIGLTGFCVKPLRAAGVMTIPELFEKRFGPFVRWLAGVVIVLGGLLNMGVFLQIGGQFLVVVTGMGHGGVEFLGLHLSYLQLTMALLLIGVAVYTIFGGMLSVLITDFLQFVVMSAGLIIITILILKNVGWSTIIGAAKTIGAHGGFNPFTEKSLGWPYVIYQTVAATAATLTWQTTIARLLAAKDTQTGCKIYTRTSFFFVCRWIIPGLWGMAALAVLTPAAFAQLPAGMQDHTLYAMPLFLSQFVPMGLMGILVAAMLAADMSTDSSYMLTWGSVIYNDIMAPFHKKAWSESKGLLWNRCIVALIGLYLLLFGLFYRIEGNAWDYLTLTGLIYLSSMPVLLIACCYWKGANDWGAIGAIIVGAVVPVAFLTLQKIPATSDFANNTIGPYYSGIAAAVLSAAGMVIGSWLKPKPTSGELPA